MTQAAALLGDGLQHLRHAVADVGGADTPGGPIQVLAPIGGVEAPARGTHDQRIVLVTIHRQEAAGGEVRR